VWVSGLRPNNSFDVDAKLDPVTLAGLAHVPGVVGVDRNLYIHIGGREELGAAAADHPSYPFKVVAGPPAGRVLARGRVLVGTALARRRHLRPGDRLQLPTPTGMASVTVGAVW